MKTAGILITLMMISLSCSIHRPLNTAETPYTMPESFSAGETDLQATPWWTTFGDPELNRLVETALNNNLTLQSAWARLEQARQLAVISGAARYPSLNGGVTGQETRYESGTGPMGVDETTSYQATATVSWQIDLWRKYHNTGKAAVLDAEAGRMDMEATAHTIAGSIADTWLALNAERQTLALLTEQARVSRNYLELVEYRFSNGLSTALAVYQQRSALAAVEALVPASKAAVRTLENTLNLLMGRAPGTPLPRVHPLPDLPERPGTGVPASVLRNRPDVRSAELRLLAADRRLAVAIADRFPSISLSYTIGGQSDSFGDVLDNWFSNLLGNLTTPLFAGGRLKAEAERNRAVVEERYLGWQSALLSAWNDVENGLALEDGYARTFDRVKGQVKLANETLDRSRDQYLNGLVDYLNVLTSLQNLQQLERQAIRSQQTLLSNRIALELALGGEWSQTLSKPKSEQEESQPEENR